MFHKKKKTQEENCWKTHYVFNYLGNVREKEKEKKTFGETFFFCNK